MSNRYDDLKSLWPLSLLAFAILIAGYAGYWPAVPLAERAKERSKLLTDDPNRVRVEWLVKVASADDPNLPVSGQVLADHRVVSPPLAAEAESAAGVRLAPASNVASIQDVAVQTQPQLARIGQRFFCAWQFHPTHLHGAGQCLFGAWSDDGLTWGEAVPVFPAPQPFGGYKTGDRLFCAAPCLLVDGQWYAVASLQEIVGFGSMDATTFETAIAVVESAEFPRPVRQILAYAVRKIDEDGSFGPLRLLWRTGEPGGGERGSGSPMAQVTDQRELTDVAAAEAIGEQERQELGAVLRLLATPDSRLWDRVVFPVPERVTPDRYRLSFPTMVALPDSVQVRLWASEQGLDRLYSEVSMDSGVNWSPPTPTNLRNGGRFAVLHRVAAGPVLLLGNQSRVPVNVADPLTISVAFEGMQFTESFDLRSGAATLLGADELPEFTRNERRGYQATSTLADDRWLWVAYSVNAGSIEVSRVSLLDLMPAIRERESSEEGSDGPAK